MEELERVIVEEIAADGPMPFSRFMELALYHPLLGYYVGGGVGREPLGWSGDYFTSGDVSPLWGWALAHSLHQMWLTLGAPTRFDVLEPGAGRGLLPLDVWRYALERAPAWAAALHYTLADRAPADSPLRARRAERLAASLRALGVPAERVRWVGAANEVFSAGSLVGCVVANELVDALPVHLVEVCAGTLAEVYVKRDARNTQFIETLGPPSRPAVATYLDRFGVPWRTYPEHWRAEVGLAAERWLDETAALLGRGFTLIVDYGERAHGLYTPDRRHGTLTVYTHHQLGERPLAHPGQQDLTAHVNFSALEAAGRRGGLHRVGLVPQRAWLEYQGIREEAAAMATRRFAAAETARQTTQGQLDYLRRASLRAALNLLLDPAGLGGFKVLIQHRGVPGARRRLLEPQLAITRGGKHAQLQPGTRDSDHAYD